MDVDNYATWQSKMKFLLITKGLWTAVTGDSVSEEADGKALAQIGLHVKDHHLPVLERCKSAKDAWNQLEAVYQAKSNARKRQLRKELSQLKMGPTEPLAKYVARAKEIQNQLQATGYEVKDQEVVWALLAGLPTQYDTIVTVLETSSDADVKLDDILPKLMPVEQRIRSTVATYHEETALMAGRKARFGNKTGRFPSNKETRACFVCGQDGHIAKNCPHKYGKQRPSGAEYHYGAIVL